MSYKDSWDKTLSDVERNCMQLLSREGTDQHYLANFALVGQAEKEAEGDKDTPSKNVDL